MLKKEKYSIHHIGGRRATSSLKHDFFQEDCLWTFYDADESCIEQIKSRTDENKTQVLPYCLFSKPQEVKFNINVDPTTNSIFNLNENFKELYLDHDYPLYGPVDFRLCDTVKKINEIKLSCTSIDVLAQDSDFIAPDILSVDAQGASYEVLEGSIDCLKSKTIAVSCEVEFVPIYEGQKLFGHVANFLNDNGFIFCCFLKFGKGSMYRESVGLRGDGFQTYADTFFLKDIRAILKESSGVDAVTRLYKTAYAALVYGYTEYTLKSLRTAKEHPSYGEIKNIPYKKFLDSFYEIAATTEYKMLQSFEDIFPRDANLRRFSEEQDEVDFDSYQRVLDVLDALTKKALAEDVPNILVISYERFNQKISTQMKRNDKVQIFFDNAVPDCEHDPANIINGIPENSFALVTASHQNSDIINQLKELGMAEKNIFVTGHWVQDSSPETSEIESFLQKNGFEMVANILKNKRKKQSYKRNPLLA